MDVRNRKVWKNRSWIYRYPKTFQITFTLLGLSIYFSKPIYDICIKPPNEPFDFAEEPTTLGGIKMRRSRQVSDA